MMKKYFNTFVKTFFFISLPIILIAMYILRTRDVRLGYIVLTLGAMSMSIFISLAIRVFKSERGKGYVNAILGYLIIIPALIILRVIFGEYLFRRISGLYILMAIILVIYGIALFIASKKYKSEVDELNRLLLKKESEKDKEEDEE